MTNYDYWKTTDHEGERAMARGEAIEDIVREYRDDPKKLAEAEEWIAGSLDGPHYSAVSLALYALHGRSPESLIGSDVLATLYRLAKVDHDAIEGRLLEMAEADYDNRLTGPEGDL
jgi:hypothetical protein